MQNERNLKACQNGIWVEDVNILFIISFLKNLFITFGTSIFSFKIWYIGKLIPVTAGEYLRLAFIYCLGSAY